MKIKKLIREKVCLLIQDNEYEVIEDKKELNSLYSLKVKEELAEIQKSEYSDILEFADLIQVA